MRHLLLSATQSMEPDLDGGEKATCYYRSYYRSIVPSFWSNLEHVLVTYRRRRHQVELGVLLQPAVPKMGRDANRTDISDRS